MSELLIEQNYNTTAMQESAEDGAPKKWFIEGVFMQSNVVNRNRRMYPRGIMESEINRYNNEYVVSQRAIGELNHPPTPVVDPNNASHKIVNIMQEGDNFIGKALILDTHVGKNVKALLEGGVQLGVSSRGMGSIKANSKGINEVQNDFKLATVDIVYQPSAPDAFVKGLMEGADYVWNTLEEDVEFLESLKNDTSKEQRWKNQEHKLKVFEELVKKFHKI